MKKRFWACILMCFMLAAANQAGATNQAISRIEAEGKEDSNELVEESWDLNDFVDGGDEEGDGDATGGAAGNGTVAETEEEKHIQSWGEAEKEAVWFIYNTTDWEELDEYLRPDKTFDSSTSKYADVNAGIGAMSPSDYVTVLKDTLGYEVYAECTAQASLLPSDTSFIADCLKNCGGKGDLGYKRYSISYLPQEYEPLMLAICAAMRKDSSSSMANIVYAGSAGNLDDIDPMRANAWIHHANASDRVLSFYAVWDRLYECIKTYNRSHSSAPFDIYDKESDAMAVVLESLVLSPEYAASVDKYNPANARQYYLNHLEDSDSLQNLFLGGANSFVKRFIARLSEVQLFKQMMTQNEAARKKDFASSVLSFYEVKEVNEKNIQFKN